MKALVLWSEPHSRNLGVRALSEGTAALLRSVDPGIDVRFQGYGPGDSPVRIGDPKHLAKQLVYGSAVLRDWLRSFDVVIDTRAGDSFADIYGLRRLTTMSLMAEHIRRSGIPLVLGPQTIGPFNSRRGRALGRRSLRSARVAMARDSASAEYSAKLGRQVDALTTDVVFALPIPEVSKARDVIINPSGLLWSTNGHVDATHYRLQLETLCGKLLSSGRRLTLLAHVLDSDLADNDVPAIRALAHSLDGEVEIVVPESLGEVRTVLASAHVVVGSRMHACLNALSVGTPAVAMAYSRKFEPLLRDLGWHHTVDIRSSEDTASTVERLVDNPDMSKAVRPVMEKAAELLEVATRALSESLTEDRKPRR